MATKQHIKSNSRFITQRDRIFDWACKAHADTNHMYDEYIPYKFHLEMAEAVYYEFCEYLPENFYTHKPADIGDPNKYHYWDVVHPAVLLHDVIEDTRKSYNDVRNRIGGEGLGAYVAEVVFAVTNNRGRDRKERQGGDYYPLMRKTPGAVFVKMCDRIANVRYGKMTGGKMYKKYQEENEEFIRSLFGKKDGTVDFGYMDPMVGHLCELINYPTETEKILKDG